MFAIVETGSKQYKVEEGDVLEVELLDKDKISAADTLNFESVLLVKEEDLHIGQPFVTDARIRAKVLEEIKGEKVIVFKKKSKKQYRRTRGHRQKLHLIRIEKIEIKPAETAKPGEVAKPAAGVEVVSEKPAPAAKETKKKAPAAKEKQAKTQTKAKKETPAAKEEQVKTGAKEKKQTKTKTSTAKKIPVEKEEEKE
jgi:large subunit ribosomal protein L21